MNNNNSTRKTKQEIMPQILETKHLKDSDYNLYPFHSLKSGKIGAGYKLLADEILQWPIVKIDGYVGVDWASVKTLLQQAFTEKGVVVNWIEMSAYYKPEKEIEEMIQPSLGAPQTIWGKNTDLTLADFFVANLPEVSNIDPGFEINIIIGIGAELAPIDAPIIYLDLPKSELLYRMRAKAITNLASSQITDKTSMYKRFYFVDWVVLNKHKEKIINKITLFADTQWDETISWASAEDIFEAMQNMASSFFRPRPWFDPGIWGGQWMKKQFAPLGADEENLAWSFEIIAPENGIVFQSEGLLLELSFDTLMYREYQAILGEHAAQYGSYFPIRFDFLDTYDGGNLSIQCHPTLEYIQKNFGEKYTQDETYYIMDCKDDAQVYLGFQHDIDPDEFHDALQNSLKNDQVLPVEQYIQRFPSKKHDLFLIPNGTVHSSGKNNLVLEISATPYIFTFKMYDWLQKDSQGNNRPINIQHAFNNLDFERKGSRIASEFISTPKILNQGQDWTLIHLPTHNKHYYDIHRYEFDSEIDVETEGKCHILMLVEGSKIELETDNGTSGNFHYAETFIVPAGAQRYRLINRTNKTAKVIKAFLKPDSLSTVEDFSYGTNQTGDGKD